MLNICKQVLTVTGLYDSYASTPPQPLSKFTRRKRFNVLGTIVKGTIKLKEKHRRHFSDRYQPIFTSDARVTKAGAVGQPAVSFVATVWHL